METIFASGGRAFALDADTGALSAVVRTPVPLSPRQAQVLEYLVENAGRQVSVAEIEAAVWTDKAPDGAVHAAVRAVMAALGDEGEAGLFIETLSQRGFRFVGGVTGRRQHAGAADSESVEGPHAVLSVLSDASGGIHPADLLPALAEAKRLGKHGGAGAAYAEALDQLAEAAGRGGPLPAMALETAIDNLSAWA